MVLSSTGTHWIMHCLTAIADMGQTPRFMVLGAGTYQVPLIQAAKKRGFHVVVASIPGNYPGIKIADSFIEVDTTDVDKIVSAALDYHIEGIATTGSDVCVPSIGAVIDRMDLPGTGYEASILSMDKSEMKERFQKRGVPTASFQHCRDLEEALEAAKSIGYPVAVKAVDSSGSRGISKVDESSEMELAVSNVMSITHSERFLVEEWLVGTEFGAQAIVSGGRVVDFILHNDTTTDPPVVVPIGHSVPFNHVDLREDAFSAIQSAVEALGIDQTVANVDLMLTANGIQILEIGARMGGTCLPELCSLITGTDFYELVIRLASGENMESPLNRVNGAWAALLIQSPRDGELRPMIEPDTSNRHELITWALDYPEGGVVSRFVTGNHRIGHIIVESEKPQIAEEIASELHTLAIDSLEWVE